VSTLVEILTPCFSFEISEAIGEESVVKYFVDYIVYCFLLGHAAGGAVG
jgi:hypothetical protein